MKPYQYHHFYAEKGSGKVLIGEVSTVNDDVKDNKFFYPIGRFPKINEDEEPLNLIVGDYTEMVK